MRETFCDTGIWKNLYQSLQKPQAGPVVTGFNANIDRVIPVTPDLLRSLEQHTVPGSDVLLSPVGTFNALLFSR